MTENTDVLSWILWNLEEEHGSSVKVKEVYQHYMDYCSKNEIFPATSNTFGRTMYLLFSCVRNVDNHGTRNYVNVRWRSRLGNLQYEIPSHCTAKQFDRNLFIFVPTELVRNNECIQWRLQFAENKVQAFCGSTEVNLNAFGISNFAPLQGPYVSSAILAIQRVIICKGAPWDEAFDEEPQVWNKLHDENFVTKTLKSPSCSYFLNPIGKKQVCGNCTQIVYKKQLKRKRQDPIDLPVAGYHGRLLIDKISVQDDLQVLQMMDVKAVQPKAKLETASSYFSGGQFEFGMCSKTLMEPSEMKEHLKTDIVCSKTSLDPNESKEHTKIDIVLSKASLVPSGSKEHVKTDIAWSDTFLEHVEPSESKQYTETDIACSQTLLEPSESNKSMKTDSVCSKTLLEPSELKECIKNDIDLDDEPDIVFNIVPNPEQEQSESLSNPEQGQPNDLSTEKGIKQEPQEVSCDGTEKSYSSVMPMTSQSFKVNEHEQGNVYQNDGRTPSGENEQGNVYQNDGRTPSGENEQGNVYQNNERTPSGLVCYYRCSVCDRQFRGKQLLTIHMRSHTGEKPYGCNYCDTWFSHHASLRAHKRTHTENRQRASPHYKRLARSTYLDKQRQHIERPIEQRQNIERPIECVTCNLTFSNYQSMYQHLLKVHKSQTPDETRENKPVGW